MCDLLLPKQFLRNFAHIPRYHLFFYISDIPWPDGDEALSQAAINAIDQLLAYDPSQRPVLSQLQEFPLFSHIDWNNIHDIVPSFVPQVDSDTDTFYFEGESRRHILRNNIPSGSKNIEQNLDTILVVWQLLSDFCLAHPMLWDCALEETGLLLLYISKWLRSQTIK